MDNLNKIDNLNKLQSFDENTEIADADVDKKTDMNFYATGSDGNVIKLHNRIASIPISFGGKQFQQLLEEEIKDYTDDQVIALAPFDIIGRGVAGIDEMRTFMDDTKCYFGFLQIQVGQGTFARYKNIFIHFQGDKMKPLSRAKANRKLSAAKEIIGHCHAPLIVNNAAQFTVDWIFNELKRVFTADKITSSAGSKTDLNTLKVNYNKRMEQAMKEAAEEKKRLAAKQVELEKEAKAKALQKEKEELLRLKKEAEEKKRLLEEEKKKKAEEERRLRHEQEEKERLARIKQKEEEEKKRIAEELKKNPTANIDDIKKKVKKKRKKKRRRKKRKKKDDWSDDRPWTPKRVLNAIHADISPFNWGLFQPSKKELKSIKWGTGGLVELRKELKENKVMYGIMRLSFGSGQFRRNWWIFFLWSPDTMTTIHKKNRLRMKHVSYQNEMQQMLKPWNVSLTAESIDKVTISQWIMRVKRTIVIDGDIKITAAEYKKALQAEMEVIKARKEKERIAKEKLKKQIELQKIADMKAATAKRISKADNVPTIDYKVKLKSVPVDPIPNKNMKTPALDQDGNYSYDAAVATGNKVVDKPVVDNNNDDDNKGSDGSDGSSDPSDPSDTDSDAPREPSPPPVIELTPQELAELDAERKKKEAEEHAKMKQNEMKYRRVLQSKLVLESVELGKRSGERLNWILFAPRVAK